jgi:hypothetical protein
LRWAWELAKIVLEKDQGWGNQPGVDFPVEDYASDVPWTEFGDRTNLYICPHYSWLGSGYTGRLNPTRRLLLSANTALSESDSHFVDFGQSDKKG